MILFRNNSSGDEEAMEQDEVPDNCIYDAYVVSMEKESGPVSGWISDHLIPNIEGAGDRPQRLCIPERDFIPGHPVLENMEDSLNQSRKVVLVLSSKSEQDGLQDFVLRLAQGKMIKESRDYVIVVFLDEIPDLNERVSFTMSFLLSSKPPLRWSDDESQQGLFWRRLRNELSQD